MKDRVIFDIGAKESLTTWESINWESVCKRIKNLRQRIFRASQNEQWNKVRSLMKLMIRSFSNLLLSISNVTQINKGKRTAGVDTQLVKTPYQRVNIANEMVDMTMWKTHPVKRIYIPKSNGKLRPLGIPTIKNRIAQAVIKNALEPVWEARMEGSSYGFRPGRATHDAVEQAWMRLNKQSKDRWVLDADIKGAFDNISHEYILKAIGNLPGRELIKQWLKAGYVESEIFHETKSGVPQGGVISPLLSNIALDGLEKLLNQFRKTYGKNKSPRAKKYGFIRYADDFVITAETKEDIDDIYPKVEEFLKHRGLELNKDKTNISHIETGFDYLGFNIRHFQGKCLVKPQKEKVKNFLKGIRQWLKEHKHSKPEAVIQHLNPIIRGWGNYYKHGVSSKTFSYIDHQIFQLIWKWCLRRHPNKGKKWVAKKYYITVKGKKWNFHATTDNRQGKKTFLILTKMSDIHIIRHVKVKGTSSPDDPKLTRYWEKRRTKYGNKYFAKGSKLHKVAINQNWKCPVCTQHLFNGEEIETHHKIKVEDGQDNYCCSTTIYISRLPIMLQAS